MSEEEFEKIGEAIWRGFAKAQAEAAERSRKAYQARIENAGKSYDDLKKKS